jgi:hypothetical protein
MSEPPKRKRRWYQFSLRTLFLVVTAFGVLLGWESHVVRQRLAALEEVKRAGGCSLSTVELCRECDELHILPPKEVSATIPFYRAWFGDESVPSICVAYDAPSGEEKRIANLFPEAKVERILLLGGFSSEPIVVPSNTQFGIPDQTLLKYEPLPSGIGK